MKKNRRDFIRKSPVMSGDSNEDPGYSAPGSLYAAGYIRGLIEAIAKNG